VCDRDVILKYWKLKFTEINGNVTFYHLKYDVEDNSVDIEEDTSGHDPDIGNNGHKRKPYWQPKDNNIPRPLKWNPSQTQTQTTNQGPNSSQGKGICESTGISLSPTVTNTAPSNPHPIDTVEIPNYSSRRLAIPIQTLLNQTMAIIPFSTLEFGNLNKNQITNPTKESVQEKETSIPQETLVIPPLNQIPPQVPR
jgi:hypothetical protein